MKKILTLPFALLLALPLAAQDDMGDLVITAQMRNRGEMQHGFGTLRLHGKTPDLLIGERVRLTADWTHEGGIEARVALQHTGVWGDEPQTSGKGSLGVSEAWAKYNFKENIFFTSYAQIGRQTLSYDDERILGTYDWSTAGRAHDALKLVAYSSHNALHAVLAVNQNSEKPTGFYDNTAGYKNMQMLWYHNNQLPCLEASLLLLNTGFESGTQEKHSTQYLHTMGGHMKLKLSKRLVTNASFYYQDGHIAKTNKVKAFLASVDAEYQASKKLTLSAGADMSSGTKPREFTGNRNEIAPIYTFQPLYGSSDKFHGAMGYFANALPDAGLIDAKASAFMRFSKKFTLRGDYHYFQLVKDFDYKGQKTPPGKSLGHEVDLRFACYPRKYFEVEGGYSVMFPLRTMAFVRPTGNTGAWQHWAWLSMNLNTTFFKHKKK